MKDKKDKKKAKEAVRQNTPRSFLYMLPADIRAKQLAEELDFLDGRQIEVWTEVNLLELTLANGTCTFEDMMEDLADEADRALLEKLGMEQVYVCDYSAEDGGQVRKVMERLTARFGGLLASDTEDFAPFLKVEEL